MKAPILPIIISVAVYLLIGVVWYSPEVFGAMWAQALHIDPAQLKGTPKEYAGALIASGILVTVLASLLKKFKINNLNKGLQFGFWIWLGFIATTHFSAVLWMKYPIEAYFIDVSYLLVGILTICGLLSIWIEKAHK